MGIIYRNYEENDIDAIIEFWNTNSGWESDMDRGEFFLRFCSSPWGQPIFMLAVDEDTNDVLALLCFLPVAIYINRHEELAYRPFGAVFKESFRSKFGLGSFLRGTHPLIKLFKEGSVIAGERNAVLNYVIPDPRWGRIMNVLPFEVSQFPLWSIQMPLLEDFSIATNITVKTLHTSDSAIDHLWNQRCMDGSCSVKRTSAYYEWRISLSKGRFKLKGVFVDDTLMGVFTLDYKRGEHQWILADLITLSGDEPLTTTLKAACNIVNAEYSSLEIAEGKRYKLGILATRSTEPLLKQIGFLKDNYCFSLAVQLLDNKRYSKNDVSPLKWHAGAND